MDSVSDGEIWQDISCPILSDQLMFVEDPITKLASNPN